MQQFTGKADFRWAAQAAWLRYGLAGVAVLAATLASWLCPMIVQDTPYVFFFMALLGLAFKVGVGEGFFVLVLAVPLALWVRLGSLWPTTLTRPEWVRMILFWGISGLLLLLIWQAHHTEARLRRQGRFQQLFDANLAGLFFFDLAGKVTQVNDTLLHMLGYTRADFEAGAFDLRKLTPPEWLNLSHAQLTRIQTEKTIEPYEKEYFHKDGHRVPVLVNGALFPDSPNEGVVLVFDLTEQRAAEADLQLLLALGERIRLSENAQELLSDCVQMLGAHLQVERCFIALINLAEDTFTVPPDYAVGASSLMGTHPLGVFNVAIVEAAAQGQALVVNDTATDPRTKEFSMYQTYSMGAFIAVGQLRDGELISSLNVFAAKPRVWQPREVALLETVAERVWNASEKLRLAEELRHSESRLRLGVAVARIGLAELNYRTRIARLNQEACVLFGLPLDRLDVPLEQIHALFHPADRSEIDARIVQARELGETGSFALEHRILLPDATVKWLNVRTQVFFEADATGTWQPQRALVAMQDITERKLAEDRLRASEARLLMAQEISNAATFEWDMLTNQVVWSRSHFRLLGLDPDRTPAEYQLWRERLHPEDRERIETAIQQSLATGQPLTLEYRIIQPDGTISWVVGRGHTDYNEAGEPLRMTGMMIDITALKTAELELAQRTQLLERLNQDLQRSNAELDAFTYIASHDLKEPLRGLSNYAQMLIEDYGPQLDEVGQQYAQTLMRLAERMQQMTDSLLHYSRLGRQALQLRETDLNQVLRETLELLAHRIQVTGAEIYVPQPLPSLQADPACVGEIFTNLLANALKYNDKPQPQIEIGWLTPGTEAEPLVFYVRDNGIGIAPKHRDTVFQIFKRLHARNDFGGGTGAGLTIVRKLVERHGGRIWFDATLGEGTTFYFTLTAPAPIVGRAD